jgi:hypothetical protein
MKIKSIIILALLFAMNFSIVHEYVFAFYDENHCNVTEYVNELQAPSNHGDICDVHFGYHATYILPFKLIYQLNTHRTFLFSNAKESYLSYALLERYKPPTA